MKPAEHIQIVELHKPDFEADDPRAMTAARLLLTEVHLGVAPSLEQLQGAVSAMTNTTLPSASKQKPLA